MYSSGIKSYVLRSGKITIAQKRSYEKLSGVFCLQINKELSIDYNSVFGNSNPVIIEIGFGSGTATAQIAEKNPEINYLGIEVYKSGIGKLLWEIDKRGLKNVRIIEGDAVEVIKMLPKNAAKGFHIFFPDPWPKKRHHKRRLIIRPFTNALCNCLIDNGYIYMTTDWEDYANWAMTELMATPLLFNQYNDFSPAQDWRPQTGFERKGLEKNHKIHELFFRKGVVYEKK